MSNVSFQYVEPSTDEAEAFKVMCNKHMQEASVYDDNFYLTQIFNYLSNTYDSFTTACKKSLKGKKEEEITDYIRRNLQNNQAFNLDGFKVNSEARNQDTIIGYYDLKFEHSLWLNQYFVLECKPVDSTKTRIDAYIHQATKNKDDDGGLYRFLINKYATNKSFGGMLGYIISNNSDDVISSLKDKIRSLQIINNNLTFGNLLDSQLLETSITNFKNSFQSNHTRVHENKIIQPIHIFHLFFDFN